MGIFEVVGGKKLKGSITPQGAKNEALQVISAVLLTAAKVTIENIPDIVDVNLQIELLERLGVKVTRKSLHTCTFQADHVNVEYLASAEFRKMTGRLRGSVMLAGPMLARFKKAYIPKPGGDKIGRRRVDTHVIGFQKMGARFDYNADESFFLIRTGGLRGSYMVLDEPSVTGTANIIMASVLAEGITTIYNCACEPYIQQLCKMLISMGAKIEGVGSNLLRIEGVDQLNGTSHQILPDMIEVGSFIGLAAITQSEITIKKCGIKHLGVIPEKFQQLGIKMNFVEDDIHIPEQDVYKVNTFLDGSILTISDHPWPGFTPDLLSIMLVVATQAKGSVLIHQKMFESRLFFVDKIIEMGAHIVLCDPHRAVVIGQERKTPLRGIQMSSPDIRAGVALLLAALSAEGTSIIQNIEQIDRGYQKIDQRLRNLGAEIVRRS
jgi:UDP-N-acetylglucosamine 1-carboxyvinyltransferase